MPVHEDEHAGKSVRRSPEHGTGNHFAGASAQTSRSADSTHACIKQITVARDDRSGKARRVQEQGSTIAELKNEIAPLRATVKEQAAKIKKVTINLEES